jgi:hypothetical protein
MPLASFCAHESSRCDRIDYNKSAFLAQGSTAMMALLVESDIMRLAEIIFVRGRALWKLIDAIF